MSFLSYLSHPALVTASVGGVSLGVVLLLLPQKTVTFGSSFSHPFLSSSQINDLSSKASVSIKKENNCEVVSGLEIERVIHRLAHSLDYVAISCENVGEGEDTSLDNKWTALFHKDLLNLNRENGEFTKEKQLKIKTVTEIRHEGRQQENMSLKTTFKSEQFTKGEIIGNWKYGRWYIDEKTVDEVKLEEPHSFERIYFVHGFSKR